MCVPLTRPLLLCVVALPLALLVDAGALRGQQRPTPSAIEAVNEIMQFRHYWLRDSTPFDACSIYEVLNRPADFPNGIESPQRDLLDRTTDPCAPVQSPPNSVGWPQRVTLQALTITEWVAYAHLNVQHGENIHQDGYTLVLSSAARPVEGAGRARVGHAPGGAVSPSTQAHATAGAETASGADNAADSEAAAIAVAKPLGRPD